MKVTGPIRNITVTQTELARALNLTQPRIAQYIKDGIIERDPKDPNGGVLLFASLKNYLLLRASKEKNAADGEEDAEASYWKEHSKHERAKRKLAELKLAQEQNKLYDAATVELAMTEQLVTLRTKLRGIPTKLAPQLEGKSKETIYEELERIIEEYLSELSEYDPKLFSIKVEESGGSNEN